MKIFLNTFFCSVFVFALSFAWIYYTLQLTKIAILLATIVTACVAYLLVNVQKEQQHNSENKNKKRAVQQLVESLSYGIDNAKLFEKLLAYLHFETQVVDYDHIIATKNDVKTWCAICFDGTLNNATVRREILQAKRRDCQQIIMFCNTPTTQLHRLANSHLKCVLIDQYDTYNLLQHCSLAPLSVQVKQSNVSFATKYAFSRKRFPMYLSSCGFLLLLSKISFIPWYNLIWATIFFVLAIYCLLNKKYNPLKTSVSLDDL